MVIRIFNTDQSDRSLFLYIKRRGLMQEFRAASHRGGRITLGLASLISFAMPLYISVVMGFHPGFSLILNSFLAYAAVVAIVWCLEALIYFAVFEIPVTYVAFFTRNIS